MSIQFRFDDIFGMVFSTLLVISSTLGAVLLTACVAFQFLYESRAIESHAPVGLEIFHAAPSLSSSDLCRYRLTPPPDTLRSFHLHDIDAGLIARVQSFSTRSAWIAVVGHVINAYGMYTAESADAGEGRAACLIEVRAGSNMRVNI